MFEEQLKAKLEELRAMLQADGGDMEFVRLEGKTVYLRLHGACRHCPHATITLKSGIERILRETIDSDIVVERVMDAAPPAASRPDAFESYSGGDTAKES